MTAFYTTLAEWWPVISPVEDYTEEGEEVARVLRELAPGARTLLELGSGGGHLAYHLRQHFDCTLSDLSPDMLAVSRRLNPGCIHVEGDMRTLDLGRPFDLVLAHDAIDYMTTEGDLQRVCDTAWRHLAPGGVVMLVPDAVAETYEPGSDVSGGDAPDGRAARLLEWSEPLAPGTTRAVVHYSFLLRDAQGRVRHAYEPHEVGLFARDTWLRILADRGFVAWALTERTTEPRVPRCLFIGRKAGA